MHDQIATYFLMLESIERQMQILIDDAQKESDILTALSYMSACEALRNEWEEIFQHIQNLMSDEVLHV